MIISYSSSGWLAPASAFCGAWCANKLGANEYFIGLSAALAVAIHGVIDRRAGFMLPLLPLGIAAAIGWSIIYGVAHLAPPDMGSFGWAVVFIGTGLGLVALLGWVCVAIDKDKQPSSPLESDPATVALMAQVRKELATHREPRAHVAQLLRASREHPHFKLVLAAAVKELSEVVGRRLNCLPIATGYIEFDSASEGYLLLRDVLGLNHELTLTGEKDAEIVLHRFEPKFAFEVVQTVLCRKPPPDPAVRAIALRVMSEISAAHPELQPSSEVQSVVARLATPEPPPLTARS